MDFLIASSSKDYAWPPVAKALSACGHNVVVYEGDKVAQGHTPLEIQVDKHDGFSVRYNHQLLKLEHMNAAWLRHPTLFDLDIADPALRLGMQSQCSLAQDALWEAVPEAAWLNAPDRMNRAEHKLSQLVTAQEIGFTIPGTTMVANSWGPLRKALPEDITFKPLYPFMYTADDLVVCYSKWLKNPESLPSERNPFPGIFQSYMPKAREWRITLVGEEAFDAAIYTDADAKDDWRRHQLTPSVRFAKEQFPDEEKQRCFAFLGKFGLRFGCFDFIESPDGEITFLECNTNGQYGWLETQLGLPITGAITQQLLQIARDSPYRSNFEKP